MGGLRCAGGEISEADRRSEALYVVDAKVWTSAGVTNRQSTWRSRWSRRIAVPILPTPSRALGALPPRPGYQSQFSPLLDARIRAESPFADLIAWMQNNLESAA